VSGGGALDSGPDAAPTPRPPSHRRHHPPLVGAQTACRRHDGCQRRTRATRLGGRTAPLPPLKAAASAMHPVLKRKSRASILDDIAAST
jgi:hypothetical protein